MEPNMVVKKVFVLGAGTMGSGIAQVVAGGGMDVLLADVNKEAVGKAIENIEKGLRKKLDKAEIKAEEKDAILSRIKTTGELAAAADADLVIEAIIEDLERKKEVFAVLDKLCSPAAILGTNTSALSITEIALATKRPERVIGIHFFNPVPKLKLVEIIRGDRTSDETVATVKLFVEKMQKTAVEVNEAPGFIVNRLLISMINEAVFLLSENVAGREAIDSAMQLGALHPIGPLALADLIGLDVVLNIMETLEKGFHDPKYRPCPLLRKMVAEEKLGRKTGSGFYAY